ncbi:serine/threonine-protein kinase [Prosthecobacter sp.]|uniref:serine/threonine-protein kinase n=1 Tax=Prosthecobacter sp. TaxID=1965333 RepID=UPI003784A5C8
MFAAVAGGVTRELRGWQPPSVEELQKMLPQYEISAFIARGGMGAVYRGTQKALKRPVAIKVLPPEIEDGDMQYAMRFKHEAQSMARLSHPNIVAVFDAGETSGGLLYFVMEYIEGTDLAQLIASESRLDLQRTVPIITAVCEALAFAHEEGIIHRDIKPANIMIDRRGRVKVADFGLAKATSTDATLVTQSNMAMGTPDFIAPESFIPGMPVDQRADLYAVGVMLYQMLTGRVPRGRFEAPSAVMPMVSQGFDAIVDKAMQTDRDQRYSTATEIKADVERVSRDNAESHDRPGPAPGAAAKGVAGKRARAVRITVVTLIVLGTGVFFTFKSTPVTAPAPGAAPPKAATPLWKKLPAPDAKFLASSDASINAEGEWTVTKGLSFWQVQGRNIGVRGELKRIAGSTEPLQVAVRNGTMAPSGNHTSKASRSLVLNPALVLLQLNRPKADTPAEREYIPLTRAKYPPGMDAEKEWVPFEFAVVGDASLASLAGVPILPVGHSPEGQETGYLQLMSGQFRNLEYLPLDGVSEGEALKLLEADAPSVASPTAPSTGARTLSPSSEPWQNVLPESAGLRLSGEAERVPEGLKLKGKCSVHPSPSQKRDRDGAIRMLWTFGDIRPQLRVRLIDDQGAYMLQARSDSQIVLTSFSNITKTTTEHRVFALKEKLQPGQDYELELRATGRTLTAKLNGEILGTVTDETYAEGMLGVGVGTGISSGSGAPVRIKALEVLHLDGSAPSNATAEPAAIKLWDTPGSFPDHPSARWEAGAIHIPNKGALITYDVRLTDVVLRAEVLMSADSLTPQINARCTGNDATSDTHYKLGLSSDRTKVALAVVVNGSQKQLGGWPLSRAYRTDEWLPLELRIVGDQITASAEGRVLGIVHDRSIPGAGGLKLYTTKDGWFRHVEYVPLDKPALNAAPPAR